MTQYLGWQTLTKGERTTGCFVQVGLKVVTISYVLVSAVVPAWRITFSNGINNDLLFYKLHFGYEQMEQRILHLHKAVFRCMQSIMGYISGFGKLFFTIEYAKFSLASIMDRIRILFYNFLYPTQACCHEKLKFNSFIIVPLWYTDTRRKPVLIKNYSTKRQ